MTPPLLELRAITKRFPGVLALDGVSLSVGAGEVIAVIGENGAGKSTLMKVLGGVHQPDGGEILCEGRPVVIRDVRDSLALGVGFIHQELNVLDNLDVGANVFLGREPVWGGPLRLVARRRLYAESEVFLKRLGLNLSPRTPLARLSIAQRQMVEIAKALSQKASVIIMDEPTSSLTLTETDRLLATVKDLRREGVGVIYISHRLGEIEQIADRAVALRDGRNAGELGPGEIRHDRMVSLMVGRKLEDLYVQGKGRSPGRTSRWRDCGRRIVQPPGEFRRGPRRDPGVRGAGGRGPFGGRAGDLRGGPRVGGSHPAGGSGTNDPQRARRDRRGHLPRARGPPQDRPGHGHDGAGKHHAARLGALRALVVNRSGQRAGRRHARGGVVAGEDAVGRGEGDEPERGQPAEGGVGEMAFARLRR